MKRFLLLLGCCAALACGAEVAGVRTVYILPMAHGLDEYLANRLTTEHVFQVVTNPKMADAVIADHLGEGLESQLEDISPTPRAKPNPEPVQREKADQPPANVPSFLVDTMNKLDNPASHSNFGRARGTVFLVVLKSREVLWSTFEPSRDTTPKELDRTASEIVKGLKRDLFGRK